MKKIKNQGKKIVQRTLLYLLIIKKNKIKTQIPKIVLHNV